MKSPCHVTVSGIDNKSPSMRREWIEIHSYHKAITYQIRLPPCGGSGLKLAIIAVICRFSLSPSMRREWIEIPPYADMYQRFQMSPSMRREWIEIYI